jgi:hypothetical protein
MPLRPALWASSETDPNHAHGLVIATAQRARYTTNRSTELSFTKTLNTVHHGANTGAAHRSETLKQFNGDPKNLGFHGVRITHNSETKHRGRATNLGKLGGYHPSGAGFCQSELPTLVGEIMHQAGNGAHQRLKKGGRSTSSSIPKRFC